MVNGKLEERMDRMCSYKHTHNSAVHIKNKHIPNGRNVVSDDENRGSVFGIESNFLPVAKAVSGDVDLAMGTSSVGGILILQGPDAGKFVSFTDVGGGLAIPDASINLKETNFWYTGDVNNFTIDKLEGFRNEAFLGGTFDFIDATASFIWSKPDLFNERVIGGGFGIGVSAIPIWISAGWNEGTTTINK